MLALPCLMLGACDNEVVRKVEQTKDGGLSDGFLYYKITSNTSESREVMVLGCEEHALDVEIPTAVDLNGEKYRVTSIGSEAFINSKYPDSSSLTSVKIPNSVTSIGDRAFAGCESLASVNIPNSVTSIGESAFAECTGLTSVTIPNSMVSIGESAFGGVYLKTFINNSQLDEKSNDYWRATICDTRSEDGLCIKDNAVIKYCGKSQAVSIPNSVTSIGNNAFYDCTGLTSITIPNSVTRIGEWAFCNCSGLTTVTIPNSVVSIENSAFGGCKHLTTVTIPNSVTSIGECAFAGCSSLTSVKIPNSVTSIGDRAFGGCTGLTSVKIPNSVISIGEDVFCSDTMEFDSVRPF